MVSGAEGELIFAVSSIEQKFSPVAGIECAGCKQEHQQYYAIAPDRNEMEIASIRLHQKRKAQFETTKLRRQIPKIKPTS
jgi:hypothetical protein